MKLIPQNITPGPWHVGIKPGPIIYGKSGEQIADLREPLLFDEENIANAKAIAALPELLKALECALDRINAANDHQREAGRMEYGTGDIIAALTKAGYTIEP